MQSSLVVLEPAKDISLITLYEARLALGLSSSTDETLDDQIEMFVRWSSAEIAAMCNRTFARETVRETFSGTDGYSSRMYLSRWPVTDISIVDEDEILLVADDDYNLDANSGTLTRLSGGWGTPVTVTYTGGYELPYQAPEALRQAALLQTREAYFATIRGDASIRMVAHKESRVIYFDPNAKSASSGAATTGGSPARRAIGDLLKHFMRFEV